MAEGIKILYDGGVGELEEKKIPFYRFYVADFFPGRSTGIY